ncbi:hypothetical protein H0H87_000932 [Tephrocybe sp. NHM501043]|nr:hypothetical protein H0H87_000932 [Tephrocybe sp. NHM501043]
MSVSMSVNNTTTPPLALTTSVASSTSLVTSDGQVFTTVVNYTTVVAPGAAVANGAGSGSGGRGANIGAIVGGVVGLLLYWRHKCAKEKGFFDCNFAPPPTAPHVSSSDLALHNLADEDDSMGGRLGTGVVGVVTSFAYVPDTTSASTHHTGMGSPEMRNAELAAAAGLTGGAGAYVHHQYQNQHPGYNPNQYHYQNPNEAGYLPNPYASSGAGGYAAAGIRVQ